jgi:hypothetical protein
MHHLKHILTLCANQTEKERQSAKLSGRDGDEDSEEETDAKAKKGKGKEKDSEKEKESKKDPYAGMSRKQKRRKMQLDQETQELAHAHAEERAEAQAGSDSDEDGKGKGKGAKPKKAANGKVRVTKADLEVAAKKLTNLQSQQKVLAKSVKREATRRQLSMDEEPPSAPSSSTPSKKRRAAQLDGGDSDGEHGADFVDMDALGRPGGRAAKKKTKRAVAEAGVSRFSSKKRGLSLHHLLSLSCIRSVS